MHVAASDERSHDRPRVAVIGGGISGLGAAHALAGSCDVTVLEASDWLGGHANTRDVADSAGDVRAVDTGFIVYNERTYPELVRLFDELGVPTKPTDMSMSVSCAECGLEYAGRRPASILASLARRPLRTARLLRDIRRCFHIALGELDADERIAELAGRPVVELDAQASVETLDAWTRRHGLGELLRTHFLVPLLAAVWSTAPSQTLDMPARTVFRFLSNHGMLGREGVQWRTVEGGSREYVGRLERSLVARGAKIRLSAPVARLVDRGPDGVTIELQGGERLEFDHVVLATHAPTSLSLLDEPTRLEREVLGAWSYTPGRVALHAGTALLPRSRAAHASWNYRLPDCGARSGPPTLTYSMRTLQGVGGPDHWCVTLNPPAGLDGSAYEVEYEHPRYTARSIASQLRLPELAEDARSTATTFCGAWQGYGFHEDGLRSGLRAGEAVAEALAHRIGRHEVPA